MSTVLDASGFCLDASITTSNWQNLFNAVRPFLVFDASTRPEYDARKAVRARNMLTENENALAAVFFHYAMDIGRKVLHREDLLELAAWIDLELEKRQSSIDAKSATESADSLTLPAILFSAGSSDNWQRLFNAVRPHLAFATDGKRTVRARSLVDSNIAVAFVQAAIDLDRPTLGRDDFIELAGWLEIEVEELLGAD